MNCLKSVMVLSHCFLLTVAEAAVPARVIVNGTAPTIEFAAAKDANLPVRVPMLSHGGDGNLESGIKHTFDPADPQTFRRRIPGILILEPDGKWSIREFVVSLTCGTLRKPWTVTISGSDSVHIFRRDATTKRLITPDKTVANRSVSIGYTYDHSGAPASLQGGTKPMEAEFAVLRAASMYTQLLSSNNCEIDFDVKWQDLDGGVAVAYTIFTGEWWPDFRGEVVDRIFGVDLDSAESDLYGSFPPGFTIPYFDSSGLGVTSDIFLTLPLFSSVFERPFPITLEVYLDSASEWCLDSRGGLVQPGQIDLEGTLVHEFGHHLGFTSNVEYRIFDGDPMDALDIFRLPWTAPPDSVSGAQFQGVRRQLTLGERSQTVAALNSPAFLFEMADGVSEVEDGGGQASHWRDALSNHPAYIGIMDVAASNGLSDIVGGSFLQMSDIRALDIIGWKINPSNVLPPPGPFQIQFPPTDAIIAPGAVSATWGSSSSSSNYNVVLYQLGVTQRTRSSTPFVAHSDFGLATTSALIPSSVLRPGYSYKLVASGKN